jgi:DNA topoisomerase I
MGKLVIVESPTKAKTISKFLGRGYKVESSFGHVRDLPKSKMGIDIEGGTFEPKYMVPKDKSAHVKKLKELAKKSSEVIFATDEDREGEAISWHLAHIFDIKPETAKRIVFHEITEHAIKEALKKPRHIDAQLVDAQQARRVLDRLVGYELSPLLWKKIARGLSAGRVQSVALRLIVEKEREIEAFKSEEYWTIEGQFHEKEKNQDHLIEAKLHAKNGKKMDKFDLGSETLATDVLTSLKKTTYIIESLTKKETKRTPPPPFRTSTLQQQANHKCGYSSKQTMRLAQQLYEGIALGNTETVGLITYMRTDSTNLSDKFIKETRAFLKETYSKDHVETKARKYKTKSKGAQEAHEAIRPSDPAKTPESVAPYLDSKQLKLYELIWKRAVATQMSEAKLDKTTLDIASQKTDDIYTFRASGQIMLFDGWMALYPNLVKEETLPEIEKDEAMVCKELTPKQHFTEPPARYSDATLVKVLEEHGIGRPSTYSPTIATIENRNYVERTEQKRLKPTDVALVVTDLLVEHFSDIVNYSFTALMEENLDDIAAGEKDWKPIISTFYHPFHDLIEEKMESIDKKKLTEEATDETCEKCKNPMIIKIGRFGKFMACSNYPDCKNTKPVGEEAELDAAQSHEPCEKCGEAMHMKRGRFGPFLGCSGYPDCKNIRKVEKKTGVPCNKCDDGEFVEKKTKKGRTFFSCNKYPDCENAIWSKPTGELCPACKCPIVLGAKDTVKCSSKECTFKKDAPAE